VKKLAQKSGLTEMQFDDLEMPIERYPVSILNGEAWAKAKFWDIWSS
jgi:hypothetical protein